MYQALYRKYRPKTFKEVIGQANIVKTLQNSVKNHHVGHAYLFTGPRGTGKTTIAKLFAKAINCLETEDGDVCGHCKNCLYSGQNECMDIIEIDAASNNGVDEIRELRNKVNILPSELKYKVYIIDEVHMLTIGAFNALLKTLEEPPEHIVFILATTDPQKIPVTIISRCQVYNFKKISETDMIERLFYISQQENIKIDKEVLKLIAENSDGCVRDAIGLLDKVSSSRQELITTDYFLQMNGQATIQQLKKITNQIFNHHFNELYENLEAMDTEGKDFVEFAKQLMIFVKNKLVDCYLKNTTLEYDEQEMIDFINLLNEKINDLKRADNVKISFEILLLQFIKSHKKEEKIISREIISNKNEKEQKENDKQDEKQIITKEKNDNINSSAKKDDKNVENYNKAMTIRTKNAMIDASKEELNHEKENWKNLNNYTFDRNNGYLACELLDGVPRASNKEVVVVSYEYEAMAEQKLNNYDELIKFYQDVNASTKTIAFISESNWQDLKKEYILLHRENKNFIKEQEPIFFKNNISKVDKKEENSMINNEVELAKSLFGDIVEVE